MLRKAKQGKNKPTLGYWAAAESQLSALSIH